MAPKKDKKGTSVHTEVKAKEEPPNVTDVCIAHFTTEFSSMCTEEGIEIIPVITPIVTGKLPVIATVPGPSKADLKKSSKTTSPAPSVVAPQPEEKHSSVTSLHQEVPKPRITVVIAYPETVRKLLLQRHAGVELALITVIVRSLHVFNTITVLKLEHCKLTAENVELLAFGLSDVQTVKELSLDGNPLVDPNYHLILEFDTRVQHLSLRLCDVTNTGAELLANQMDYVGPGNDLLTLNLNNNMIANKGAKSIAHALRSNRTLASLSLAGNRIGDKGAASLARSLGRFKLFHHEVVFRRRRIATCYAKFADMNQRRSSVSTVSTASSVQKEGSRSGSPKRKRSDKKLGHGSVTSRTTISSKKSKNRSKLSVKLRKNHRSSGSAVTIGTEATVEELIRRTVVSDGHPFMSDVTPEAGALFCSGNLRLAHLNVAYNKIAGVGMLALYHALDYQASQLVLTPGIAGVFRLILEGNPVPPPFIQVLDEIADILQEKNNNAKSVP